MGVQGLWELLAPVGRRVSVETLAGKKLAIDASIWMIQFMKAMRDEKGEMVRNAHLLGFFRRICKLLFLRTKPVFVFDGGTPALKRRTVIARRRQRENAQAKIRKTAEKLLLNHLKAKKLEELANDIKNMKDKNDLKGKNVASKSDTFTENNSVRDENPTVIHNQELIDELLAASLAAEEDGNFSNVPSTSVADVPFEEDDGDDNEEMILPLMHGNVDPTVLASLPPSMQLDLLVQMRERLMAENRQKYQKVKKTPSKFSELQIQAYLKTVAFRREIDEVQKSAAGRGVGGVQSARIASEANREFIFSSSFTGNKQILASVGVDEHGDTEHQIPTKNTSSKPADCNSSASGFYSVTGTSSDETRNEFHNDVETYVDDGGRVRVSRLRGLGIRMTRDLQRNLDLMKEFELEKIRENIFSNAEAAGKGNEVGSPGETENSHLWDASAGDVGGDETSLIDRIDGTSNHGEINYMHKSPNLAGKTTSMEISFLEDDSGLQGSDDDEGLFASLVAGSSVSKFSSESVLPCQHSDDFVSVCTTDKPLLKNGSETFSFDREESRPSFVNGNNSDDAEVDWEDGVCDVSEPGSSCPNENIRAVSKGSLEEEACIQEAIRRSLGDFMMVKSPHTPSEAEQEDFAVPSGGDVEEARGNSLEVVEGTKDTASCSDVSQIKSLPKIVKGVEKLETLVQKDILQNNRYLEKDLMPFTRTGVETSETYQDSTLENHDVSKYATDFAKAPHAGQISKSNSIGVETTCQEKCLDNSNRSQEDAISLDCNSGSPRINRDDGLAIADPHAHDFPAALRLSLDPSGKVSNLQESFFTDQITENDSVQDSVGRENVDNLLGDRIACQGNSGLRLEESQEILDEEMQLLKREEKDLGDEQRKLERNAESVSSEMFAECQELLQMFGLPYIIAPMEAEAQCAYMELMNLVDGVVTDDSDVFLFGARSVYKNIFDDRKYVETYFMKDIESELGLMREKLIRIAMLLGSDYTEGVSGIGIVNAMEVVNAFPEEDGLQKFREWLESPDPSILGKLNAHAGNNSRKRKSKASTNGVDEATNILENASEESHVEIDGLSEIKQIFMEKHRNVSKNWHIPSSFPSEQVISAYTAPQVDKSTESFSWGKPDLFVLRKLCWERFGWSNQKADELLLPVLKEYSKHETQLRLEAFYTFNERFAKIRSRRIKKAVKGITGNQASELMDDPEQGDQESSKKRKGCLSKILDRESCKPSDAMDVGDAANKSTYSENSSQKQTKGSTILNQSVESEVWHSSIQKTRKPNARQGLGVSARSRGRGRARKGIAESLSYESTESSSSDGDHSIDINKTQPVRSKEESTVHCSLRPRKKVNYVAKDVDIDDYNTSLNISDGNCSDILEGEQSFCGTDKDGGVIRDGCDHRIENQTRVPPLESTSSKEYLFIGGGFCIEHEDQHENSNEESARPTRASEELLNAHQINYSAIQGSSVEHMSGSNHPNNMNELQQENMTEPRPNECGSTPSEQMAGERESFAVGKTVALAGLSALPSLKRKRKAR